MEEIVPSKEIEELGETIGEEEEFISIEDEEELLEKIEKENQALEEEVNHVSTNQLKETEIKEQEKMESEAYPELSKTSGFSEQETLPQESILISQESLNKRELSIQTQETSSQKQTENLEVPQQARDKTLQETKKAEPSKEATTINLKKIEFTKVQTPKTAPPEKVIMIPPSQRPDGSIRKAKKIRPNYVPPEEQIIPSAQPQPNNKDANGKLETASVSQPKKTNMEESASEMKVPGSVSDVLKNLPNYLKEQGLEVEGIESIFKSSSRSILQAIEKYRKAEGTFLIQTLAQQYGLKVTIEDPTESEPTNDSQALKRRKLTTEGF